MRSKTSCFNGTLFRKNLSRYWPLWGLASFGGALFPLAMLVNLLHSGFDFWTPLETTQAYYNVLSYGVTVISIVYAVLCAMAVWNYLYNTRSVGLMHTLFTLEDNYGLKVTEQGGELALQVDFRKNKVAARLHEMLWAWREQAAKLEAGEISQEDYDRWRYHYPEYDGSQVRAKVPPEGLI